MIFVYFDDYDTNERIAETQHTLLPLNLNSKLKLYNEKENYYKYYNVVQITLEIINGKMETTRDHFISETDYIQRVKIKETTEIPKGY
ncbi:MAG: hypothetical protein AABY22_23910 [Nanoarchaeota archaeon]